MQTKYIRFMALSNPQNLKFISDNYRDMTDEKMASILKVSRTTITTWRVKKLNLKKMIVKPETRPYKYRAKKELASLLAYNYSGIMKDSIDHRIKFLTSIVFDKK